jgi:hypothetical protein
MNILVQLDTAQIQYERVSGHPEEILLECPICLKGKEHARYDKLFFNIEKKVGICHRCGWTGRVKELYDIFYIEEKILQPQWDFSLEEKKSKSFVQELPPSCIHAWDNSESRDYLRARKVTLEEVERYGILYCREGYYAQRIVVPIYDHHERYRTFISRTIYSEVPKYKYPRGSCISSLLYGLNFCYQQRRSVWLVEGVFDYFHCYPYALATFGKNIHDKQITLLRMAGITDIFLVFDTDSYEDTPDSHKKVLQKLSRHFFTYDVKLPCDTVTEYDLEDLKDMCYESTRC